MIALLILTLSIFLQFVAAFMAFRLIPLTGRRTAWSLITAALMLMALRRCVSLFRVLSGDTLIKLDFYAELLALLISVIMAVGISRIAPIFTDRKRAEEALRESEEQYRTTIDSIEDIIHVVGSDLRIILVNKAINEWAGIIPIRTDIVGMTVFEAFPFLPEKVREEYEQVFRTGKPLITEDCTVIEGGKIYTETRKIPVIERASVVQVITILRDITEHKRMEKELEREQAQLFLIFDQMPAEVSVLDAHTYEVLFMNRCAQELYGKDGTGRFCYEVFHGYETPCRSCNNEYLLGKNDDEPIQREVFSERLGRHYLSTNSLIHWPDGRLAKLQISIDNTDRKRAEEDLRDSEERYRRIIEASSDAVLLRCNGIVIYVNPAACKLFRADHPEDLIGKQYLDLVHPDDRALSAERTKKSIDENWVSSLREHRILALDGQVVYVESNGVPITYQGETQIFGVFRDISVRKRVEGERRSLEERLQRAEKMEALGQLAGGVAHDLNNVLGILSGYSELLLEEIPEGHRSRGYAEKILRSTEKGAAIIQDLLTLARRGVAATDAVNLNSVVSDYLKTPVFDNLQNNYPRVTFRTVSDKNLLNIKGSSVHLEKTLMNLVSNAAESISGIGDVTIRTESRYLDKPLRGYDEVTEGNYSVLTVSDTGVGIPAENREKIFEPFYTKKMMGRSGTGLGLAIVWGTVKDHNGYIDVQTEIGKGTTFTLYFPVTRDEVIVPRQKAQIEQYMGKGESVLVVDDIDEQRDVAARLLARLGYEVHSASSGEEAVEYLKTHGVDILVLDMIMTPGIDGLETYRRILEINPKQKAILVSGFSETDRVKEAQKLGAGAYVKKPYIMEKIGVAIRDELLGK